MNNETVELESGIYEVIRLKMRDVAPLMEQGEMDGMALAKIAILKDGQPLGDAALDLYFNEFSELMSVVNRINGLGGEEGND